ncbi:MAG: hypothetical protein ABI603_07460 [Acidobacteriota bacterium]
MFPALHRLIFGAACLMTAVRAAGQGLPESPLRTPDGRLVVSAEAVATIGPTDNEAYFNYTDYEHDAMRLFRLSASAVWKPAGWLALASEVRSENLEGPRVYAAYARIRPFRDRPFDVTAGRIPPAFGAFARRAYGTDNAVIGYPLAYQYLTSLRSDAAPVVADDLLRMRGRGWRPSFPLGSQAVEPGVPLVSGFRWDTGVGAAWTGSTVQVSAALTNGTLSNPRVGDDNAGKQISGRVAVTPIIGLVVGASGAAGEWLARGLPAAGSAQQRAFGADAEYSRGHWIVRGELVFSRWALPVPLPPAQAGAVSALGRWVEGRYRLTPRVFVAGRIDHLGFSRLTGSSVTLPWDAPVSRVEAAAGYYLRRNLVARMAVQRNRRDGGRVRGRTIPSVQLAYWF